MRSVLLAAAYAWRDYRHEALLSACAVLGLAAVLAPLLVLMGVRHGVISAMTDRLLHDPRTLEITPVGSGKYGPDWFREVSALPETGFVIPQTRSIAATVNLNNPAQGGLSRFVSPVVATAKGDPLMEHWGRGEPAWQATPGMPGEQGASGGTFSAATGQQPVAEPVPPPAASAHFSESIARKLKVAAGDTVRLTVERIKNGKRESAGLQVTVLSVLPPEAWPTDALFVPLELLVATEDYRDGKAVPFLGWTGDYDADATVPPPAVMPGEPMTEASGASGSSVSSLERYAKSIRENREYASFRLYARGLDDVTPLWRWFQANTIEVYVRSAEIENVKTLDRAFGIVFGLITGAALFGFMASTASSTLAAVRRKSRSLGVMRLLGVSRWGILLFPMLQALLTGFLGSLLALALYAGVALSIDRLFAASLPGGESVCSLPPAYIAAAVACVTLLSVLASLAAAWQATKIQPSEVIRDV